MKRGADSPNQRPGALKSGARSWDWLLHSCGSTSYSLWMHGRHWCYLSSLQGPQKTLGHLLRCMGTPSSPMANYVCLSRLYTHIFFISHHDNIVGGSLCYWFSVLLRCMCNLSFFFLLFNEMPVSLERGQCGLCLYSLPIYLLAIPHHEGPLRSYANLFHSLACLETFRQIRWGSMELHLFWDLTFIISTAGSRPGLGFPYLLVCPSYHHNYILPSPE